jgi:hypothetical protein
MSDAPNAPTIASDQAPAPEPTIAPEQRKNFAIRAVSQTAFVALLDTLEAQGLTDMVKNLRGMGQVENVMRKSPTMVGMLVSLAWKFREAPMLAGLFTNAAGTIVAHENEPMGPCGRTFDEIRKSHLHGTARLFITRRTEGTKASGKSPQSSSSGFFKKLTGLFSRKSAAASSKADMGMLYQALKPHLHYQYQFEMIPAYATMTLRQVSAIGGLLPAIQTTAAIRNFGALAAGPAKAIIKLSTEFASIILSQEQLREPYFAAVASFTTQTEDGIDHAIAGYALNKLLTDYSDVIQAVVTDEDSALQLVRRLAPTAGIDMWQIFRQPEQAVNIRFCPEPIAQILGAAASMIHEAISSSLAGAKNLDAAGIILAEMLKDMGAEDFARAAGSLDHMKVWDTLVANINRADALDSGTDLTLPATTNVVQSLASLALRDFEGVFRGGVTAKAA